MGNALRSVVFLLSLFVAQAAHAAFTCPSGQVVNGYTIKQRGGHAYEICPINQTYPSEAAVFDACFVQSNTAPVVGGGSYTDTKLTGPTGQNVVVVDVNTGWKRFYQKYSRQTLTPGFPPTNSAGPEVNVTAAPTCGTPPPPPECEEKAQNNRRRLLFVSPGQTGQICDSNCMMNLGTLDPEDPTDLTKASHLRINTAGGGSVSTQGVYASYTGAPCSGTPQLSDVEVDKETLPGGKEGACQGSNPKACISNDKPNCGYAGSGSALEYRCITPTQLTPENPCAQTASGAVYCRADAPPEAKPNNGTPGQPAEPDVEFTLQKPGDTSGTVINYYKPSTVQGDSNDPGNDDDGPEAGNGDCGSASRPCKVEVVNADEIGGGDGEGEGEGDGSASGDGCEVEPSCDGDPVQCYLVKKQWETMCALAVPTNANADEAINAAAGEELSEPGSLIPEYDPDGGEPGINVLEQLQSVITDAGSPSACIADLPLSLNIGGRAANSVVPLSQMCDLFKVVGLFVMLSAAMRSAWIIMRGYGG